MARLINRLLTITSRSAAMTTVIEDEHATKGQPFYGPGMQLHVHPDEAEAAVNILEMRANDPSRDAVLLRTMYERITDHMGPSSGPTSPTTHGQ